MHKVITLLVEQSDINSTDFRRNTPFIAAAANGDLDSLKILVESKHCKFRMKNIEGQSALHRACYFGEIATVDWLLANTDLKVRERDRRGNNCLHAACEGLNIALSRYLMSKVRMAEEKLLTMNNDGKRPLDVLMLAIEGVQGGHQEKIELEHLRYN